MAIVNKAVDSPCITKHLHFLTCIRLKDFAVVFKWLSPAWLVLWPHGLRPSRLLYPWDFPVKDTGVGCHFLLQGIFLAQGSSPCLLHWQMDSLPLSHQGSPPDSRMPQSHPHKMQPCGLMTSLVQLITQREFYRESRYNTPPWVQQALDPDLLTSLSDSPHMSLFLTPTVWRYPKDK